MANSVTKDGILSELHKWELCDFFLRAGLQKLTQSEIDGEVQFYKHFLDSNQMQRLESIISDGLGAFGETNEKLQRTRQYGLSGKFHRQNFEAFRGVLRAGSALRRQGFSNLILVNEQSMADISAQRNTTKWAIEVKTLVYTGQDWVGGKLGNQKDVKIDWVANEIERRHMGDAKKQLENLAKKHGCGKRVLLEVVNRDFVAGLFFDQNDFACIHNKLLEAGSIGNSIDYIGFLANDHIHFFPQL